MPILGGARGDIRTRMTTMLRCAMVFDVRCLADQRMWQVATPELDL